MAWCSCTFTPGVEQHVDVVSGVVCGDELAVCAVRLHRELVSADDRRGWRINRQLYLSVVLFHNSSLPAAVLQVLHKRDDDMGSLRHRRQRPWRGEMRQTSPTCEGIHRSGNCFRSHIPGRERSRAQFNYFHHNLLPPFNLNHTCIPTLCGKSVHSATVLEMFAHTHTQTHTHTHTKHAHTCTHSKSWQH